MSPFSDDEKSHASSDDEDEEMEDAGDEEAENEDENADDEDGQEDTQVEGSLDRRRTPDRTANDDQLSGQDKSLSAAIPFRPALRPETVDAPTYDIVPTIAAPHSTSINAITATPDTRWVFSGGSDGWVRKFNWIDTVNSRSMLTVAQKHPFVDSVQKAGVLASYWENEATKGVVIAEDGPSLSPVYSLAVQHQALWLFSGTESGTINLQSIRHDEGKRITSLSGHSSAVSVMSLSRDEQSLLSGSWDKCVHDWDLNTGQIKRSFLGSGSQISSIEIRPVSDTHVPRDVADPQSFTLSSDTGKPPRAIHALEEAKPAEPISPGDSLFGGGGDSLFGDNDGSGMNGGAFAQDGDDDDEFGRAFAGGIDQQPTESTDLPTEKLDPVLDFDADMEPAGDHNINDLDLSLDLETEDLSNGTSTLPEEMSSEDLCRSETIFLDSAIDGTLRVWDRRDSKPVARMLPPRGTPPWCMHACWSHDGNSIYAGRRNGTVDEYDIHKGLREPRRTLHFPSGSGAVSAVRAMPNSKHLICASFDILRLYDLKDDENAKKSTVPFLIVPGHRTGVVSQLYIDPTCSFLISTGGNRGWDGTSTEVLLGYEIGVGR